MSSRSLLVGLGLLVALAGCFGAVSPAATDDPAPASSRPSATLANFSYGDEVAARPEAFPNDDPPTVTANGSHLQIAGSIPGIGDGACVDVSAALVENERDPLALVVRSRSDPPSGRACNATARQYAYRATIDVARPHPETIVVRHVHDGQRLGSWRVSTNDSA